MMKKGLAKRILVSLLTVVMISASVLPMLVSTANVARANENVTNVLTEGVEIDTPNVVKDETYSDYVKVTFIVNDTNTIVKYVKTGDTVTVRSTNSSVGVLVGDAPNGSAVTEDTTIYVKTYNYKDVLNIKKELVNEYGEPDSDGYYTLKFTAGAKNMPSIHAQAKNVVLVIDCSLSMACATDYVRGTDPTTGKLEDEKMAGSYNETRWKAMYDSVSAFLNAFLPEGNTTNSVALVKYNKSAGQITGNAKDAKTITDALNGIFNEDIFNTNKSNGVTAVDKITNSDLGSGTNVANGLEKANTILGDDKDGASIILFTDGMANYPKAKNITSKYTYKKGDIYPYGDPAVNYTLASNMSHGFYNGETEAKDQDDEMYAAYCANAAGKELADAGVTIYSFALMNATEANSDAVRASMGDKLLTFEESELIVSGVSTSKLTLKLASNYTFTYGAEKTGYAKEFYSTTNASELEKKFQSIITSLKELPFDTATVTDKLDEHFELVPGQTGVTDNGNGTFTVTYPNKITTDAQEITVKIKAKDGYAGSSYTNAGCTFNATVGDLTYSQDFVEEPSAVITPDAVNDSYTVNQGETLIVADESVLDNDNNIKVNNPDKNVTIKAEKVTDPQNGTITFNEDGTFTYTPNNGFSGEDTFRYKTVLTVDGRTYEKEATVTITVVPKYTQTIKYVFENDTKVAEDNVQTVVKGNSTTAVTSPSIPGYKPSIEVVEATQLTGDKEITVKYVRDDEQTKNVTYTVEYYKDNVKDDTKTQSYTNPIWVNATEQQVKLSEINTTDKFGAGYKFEKTDPATIPSTIADKGVIKVYYVADTFDYSVKYVIEGTDTELVPGYTKSATFGTEVGADKKNIEGYTVLNADEKLTIGADSDSNVLVIKYRANTYGYSVEYYYDGVKDESATENKTSQFNTIVNSYDSKEKTGYKFEKTENLPLTITTDASKNVIKVYYVKDASQTKNITYTVKYFKDGVEVTADEQKETKQIWVNDTKAPVEKSAINTTDKYEGFSFDADTTGVIPDTIGNDGVIRVYYVSNEYEYTVEYYFDDVIDNSKTDTFKAKYNTQVNTYADKKEPGYKFERATAPITITTDASKNVIRVYYVKDWFKYTINYYYDGVIDTSATINDKAAFGTTIKYTDKVKPGFKFVKADGSPLVISINEAANVINVYYQSNSYAYTVEYYYDGIINTEKTEKSAAKYNSVVNDYTDKCDTGYKFEKVEGLPLTIATDESQNVIRVYYVKDESQTKNITYTVKYFKDGTEVTEDQQTKTDTVWVNASSNMTVDKTAINTTDKYVGYKLDTSATGTIPDTVTDGDVINVYYVRDNGQKKAVSYTVEYYKDGVKDDSKTETFTNNIWVNDNVQPVDATKINVTDKFGAGYKFEKTDPATIPVTIADNGVIKVYYVAKEFKYTVKYVLEGTDTELTAGYTKSATYATEVGADKKNIEGYTVLNADEKLTIGSDESQNVLVIEYRANTYGYSVEYYYDGVKDESATLNKSAQFNTKVNSYDPGEKTGYKFEKTENLPLTITTDASKNIIKVYYVKDASQTKNITYTVKYFKDGAEVTADKQTVTKTVWVNAPSELTVDKTAINTMDKYVGYKLDSASTGEIPTVVADGTVINVYYVKDELQTKEVTYTVKYFRDGVEVTADKQTVTKRIWINAPLEVEVNKTAINTTDKYVGYKLDSVATGEIPAVVASGTVINVYYVKDASQTKDVTYTIKYYKDGEEQTEDTITVTKKVWVNEPSVIDVNKADINTTDKYEGYTFDSETTGIIPNKADNGSVIKVYYKKVVVPAEPSSDNSQETVKTGDNSNIMLYVLMLATCVAGATTVVVTGRKKSEQE
ncbi:MAG TPA: hypothetical protein DCL84_01560 [Eubacterium sp.]|nr:hypothetical protein [Eubacterium sp.]